MKPFNARDDAGANVERRGYRARLLYFADVRRTTSTQSIMLEDGLLVIEDGRVAQVGEYGALAPTWVRPHPWWIGAIG